MGKTTVTLTTINIPQVVEKLEQNRQEYGHKDVDYIVVGDRKSPPETNAYVD